MQLANEHIQFSTSNRILSAVPAGNYSDPNPLNNVTVMGVKDSVAAVKFNGADLGSDNWSLDGMTGVLDVTGLESFTADGAWATMWKLEW